jgi:hypothetical protein
MTKKLNKVVDTGEKTKNGNGKNKTYQKQGESDKTYIYNLDDNELDIKIDNVPIQLLKRSNIDSVIFDNIQDLDSKMTEVLNILTSIDQNLNIVNQRLNTLESRVGVLETN